MSTAVFRRFESRERDDDLGSEVSTIRGSNIFKSVLSDSDRTMRCVNECHVPQSIIEKFSPSCFSHANSATRVQSQIYKCESFASDSGSDQDSFHEDEIDQIEETIQKVTKVKKIDLSPENIKKREENFKKWAARYW